jgi:tetratricopeptide (TPR) repeat protein
LSFPLLYEIFISPLHIPDVRPATGFHLTDSSRSKYDIVRDTLGDAYTDGDHDVRNAGADRLQMIALRPNMRTQTHSTAMAPYLRIAVAVAALAAVAVNTLLVTAANAQNAHDQQLAWCTGDDVGRKIAGCSALIDSGQQTPETLAIAHLNRGKALDDNGQIDTAIQDYDQAIKNNPQSAEALYRRGAALEKKGDFDRAITDLDSSLKLDPKNAKAFAARGQAHSRKKEFPLAIADYTQSITLDSTDAVTLSLRAYAYDQNAQYDLALQDCEQALKLDSDNALAYYARGLAKQKKGDKSGAKADIAKAKQLDPKVDQQ